jgi:hypothetical protein
MNPRQQIDISPVASDMVPGPTSESRFTPDTERLRMINANKRVALVVPLPFTDVDHPKYEIDRLLSDGCEIDIIDLSAIMYPMKSFPKRNTPLPQGMTESVITKRQDFNLAHQILGNANLIICSASSGHLNKANLAAMRLISASKTPYIIIYRNPVPLIDRPIVRSTIFQRLRRLNVANSILNRMPLSALGVRAADYIILGGRASLIPMRLISGATKKIWSFAEVHQEFHDEIEARPRINETKTAVYIDQNFAFHPDMAMVDRSQYVDPDKIYSSLRTFFSCLEAALGVRVVIAAHPKADYSAFPELFGNREIIYRETARLIRECQLAICFYSTAANLAVMFRKPLAIIKLAEIQKIKGTSDAPDALAQVIGTSPINISDPHAVNFDNVMHVDAEKYQWFIERYIKSDVSSGLGVAEIISGICRDQGLIEASGIRGSTHQGPPLQSSAE